MTYKDYPEERELLQKCFPDINISELSSHNEIEQAICNHIQELTEEQWRTILGWNVKNLFQNGTPHFDWNTDRSLIFREIERLYKPLASGTYEETWYRVTERFYEVLPGFCLRLKHEHSRSLSGNDHRYITVVPKEEVPVRTHSAAIILLDNDGAFHILDQMTGTEEACKSFIARKCANYYEKDKGYITFELVKR